MYLSGAQAEAYIDPPKQGGHHGQSIPQVGPSGAQRAAEAIHKPHRRPHGTSGQKPPGGNSRGGHPKRRRLRGGS